MANCDEICNFQQTKTTYNTYDDIIIIHSVYVFVIRSSTQNTFLKMYLVFVAQTLHMLYIKLKTCLRCVETSKVNLNL